MIFDKINQLNKYDFIFPEWEEMINIWEESKNKPVGRYDWSKGFYMIQEGLTVDVKEALFEAHENYIDIQIVLDGQEICELAPIDDLKIEKEYDKEKDIAFYSGKGKEVKMNASDMYILYPHDGHKPCCHDASQTAYKKLVIKYEINQRGDV